MEKLGSKPFILVSPSGMKRVKEPITKSFGATTPLFEEFCGECSKKEINRLIGKMGDCDVVIGVGGGKILDTVKAVAHYAKKPVVIVPTIASTDAPCSALSVIYSDEGVFEEYLFLPANPVAVNRTCRFCNESLCRICCFFLRSFTLRRIKKYYFFYCPISGFSAPSFGMSRICFFVDGSPVGDFLFCLSPVDLIRSQKA